MESNPLLKDPRDLASIPEAFFLSEKYQRTTIWQDEEELKHYRSVVASFLNYQFDAIADFNKQLIDFSRLSQSQLLLLKYPVFHRVHNFHQAMIQNHRFFLSVVSQEMDLFDFPQDNILDSFIISPFNKRQVRNMLKQLRREWSQQGRVEREEAFTPIFKAFSERFPDPIGVRVLVPGCGLGRLPYELAKLGYSAQGNEFSYFMLLVSKFILNKRAPIEQFTIYPGICNSNNLWKLETAFQGVTVPDEPIMSLPQGVEFSMASGHFIEVYSHQESKWDAVVTCFFIDTAKNILEYIQVIHRILNEKGVWINLGPLMYHYSDSPNEMSIELSLEEVIFAARAIGFEILSEDIVSAGYCREEERMLDSKYNCSLFVARK
jgi:carnosine N-methyltransferase